MDLWTHRPVSRYQWNFFDDWDLDPFDQCHEKDLSTASGKKVGLSVMESSGC
jgi:hypothetical protein